ncbi:flagellar brake protein [Stenotrophomonas sp.]|uniref:flagellar brake protein n=1 Tax=Stenotrophomonas sp. TaxID=69392 RepID=UPI0028996B2E|nr:flagellar brake protein [Stenotrophomonas sp.]
MSVGSLDEHDTTHAVGDDGTDDRFLVRNPRQIRQLLQALIDQRSLINAHLGGRDQSFPTAILELDEDEDWLLLDGSPSPAANRAAEEAGHLLCFAQLDRVMVRFRIDHLERTGDHRHIGFRAPFPTELVHLQRRELYRLETPITDSPHLLFPVNEERSEALHLRVVDISAGGLAVTVPASCNAFGLQKRYDARLDMPDSGPLQVSLIICNQLTIKMANGTETKRIGMRFDGLPRGGDSAIQRYIFRIDRQRSARKNGD